MDINQARQVFDKHLKAIAASFEEALAHIESNAENIPTAATVETKRKRPLSSSSSSAASASELNEEVSKKTRKEFPVDQCIQSNRAITLHFDGACSGNPGPSGAGWILTETLTGRCLGYGYRYLGSSYTNNEAEYHALLEGLKFVLGNYSDTNELLTVKGDSKLIINQTNGTYKCNAEGLIPLCGQAKGFISLLRNKYVYVEMHHVDRELNREADFLAGMAVKKQTQLFMSCDAMNPETKRVDLAYLKQFYRTT